MRQEHPVILVKKRRPSRHMGASHGTWKIAYADFMTAMMAFFLVMWLVSISSPQVAMQIADYFRTPLKLALTGGKNISTSTSTIPGGGNDVTQKEGEVKKEPRSETQAERKEKARFGTVKQKLDKMIEANTNLKELRPHLLVDVVDEGLRIRIIDIQNKPMFQSGSAEPLGYMRDILHALAPVLNELPNKISISGHTDNTNYFRGEDGYSNWELSADRANASRRELMKGGLADGKVLRILGMGNVRFLADRQKWMKVASKNRRISILVLNSKAEAAIINGSQSNTHLDLGPHNNQEQQSLPAASNAPPPTAVPVNEAPVNKAPINNTVPAPVTP